MNIRRYLTSIIILFGFMLSGCRSHELAGQKQQSHSPTTIGIVYDTGGIRDRSFNESAHRGVVKAEKELGVKVHQIETNTINDYEPAILSLIQKHTDLIIVMGITTRKVVENLAKEYPHQKFVAVDSAINLPNVCSLLFNEQEGSFLVGYIASLVSKSKKVGFIGGMEMPLLYKFYVGFAAGAETENPSIKVLPPKFIGSWSNVDAAKTAADFIYSQGADVIFQAAGPAGMGVMKVAKEQGKFAIGVDSDQDHFYPGYVLTSMMKFVDHAIFDTIREFKEGRFSGGEKLFGLKEEGVGISEMKYTRHMLSEEDWKSVEKVKQEIISGKIKVPSTLEGLRKYQSGLKKEAMR